MFVFSFVVVFFHCYVLYISSVDVLLIYSIIILSLTLHHIRNIRSGLHGETENEREVLVQEQRYCRARARKLSLETNRRRK